MDYGYGLWALVIINSVIFIAFAASFFHPANRRDWKAMGAFSAFIVALFTEMYGFPLTIYLLTGVFGSRFGVDLTHNGGHLWADLIGWKGDPHFSPFHLASYFFIAGGLYLIYKAWKVLWAAAGRRELAVTGPYAYVRHPQYAGFLAVMVGFLLQWPTLPTLVMFPVLVVIYRRLSISEERAVRDTFGPAWDAYAAVTPRFVPSRHRRPLTPPSSPPAAVQDRGAGGSSKTAA
ncbi:methyltransferase family protein [Actinomarinicola tropica]|uniref:Isoprenylcysteine carboxylmethyltransferase family protein n=1 Tax=Actinomarinicola tropica TaxID=2789776 RepID=A0A5Q2REP2_9ACTN|nr:isoprenylcysteine carboxylmethyltransferase family protein [Actinomarinicola tropica]QGG94123.1 isoprenylcysteine carboxylmethyltransferase family protein [Actinomarinicola tropica]